MPKVLKKRYAIKLKEPNPLFVEWITEWRDEAIESNSKMQYCFKKALKSLKSYPLPLESGKDCKILDGFGEKLCQMLDKQLSSYLTRKTKLENRAIPHVKTLPTKNIKYVPSYRSGAYAILLTLYRKNLEDLNGYMLKNEIIRNGQELCDKSFTKPDPNSYYTSWSAMRTLLDKKLVTKCGCPAKFSLTIEGLTLAQNLHSQQADKIQCVDNTNCNRSTEQKTINDCISNPSVKKTTSKSLVNHSHNLELSNKTKQMSKEISNILDNTIIFAPHTFEIVLLVDCQETMGKNTNYLDDPLLSGLSNLGVNYEIRNLKIGDYVWICRHKDKKQELLLPFMVERKRMDDFGSSIKDGRFHEQKFRMKRSGIQNLIYLVENFGSNSHTGLPLNTLYQAATNTLIQDGFSVKFTDNLRASVQYLSSMTNILNYTFKNKTLVRCAKEDLPEFNLQQDLIYTLMFEDFNKSASKNKDLTVKELFIRNLVQLKGVSVDKALAISNNYSTPRRLREAYSALSTVDGEVLLSINKSGKLKEKISLPISKSIYQLYNRTDYM